MSCACPIVASSTEPVQVITDGVNGLLVNFFSPEALAAVTDLLSNASLSHKLGRAARQKILSEYSLSKCLPRHLQLINLVASRAIGSSDYFSTNNAHLTSLSFYLYQDCQDCQY